MDNSAQIKNWYKRGQVDYTNHYMALYAAFNAWYRWQTKTTNDRQALNSLQQESPLWLAYRQGKALHQLQHYMVQLAEFTQRQPLSNMTNYWQGEVQNKYDWASLLEYWYRVRCLVMHGDYIQPTYVYLAYQTLNIFMEEVIRRDCS